MSPLVASFPRPADVWVMPETMPLDERAWEKWIAKTQVGAHRGIAARFTGMKWLSIATLATGAFVWPDLPVFETIAKLIVTTGAMFVMAHFFDRRNCAMAVVFGALALLYNPVIPVFSFTGSWQRAVVAVSAAPFAALLSGFVSQDKVLHHG